MRLILLLCKGSHAPSPILLQRRCRTLDYIESFPHNLPNGPAGDVYLTSHRGYLYGNLAAYAPHSGGYAAGCYTLRPTIGHDPEMEHTCCRIACWKARDRDGHNVPARRKTEVRVRRCGLRRKWRGAGRPVMTGGGKGGDVIAVVIGILLCSSGKGSGGVMARGRDTSRMDMRCQRRCWRMALARAMPTCPLASQPRPISLNGRGRRRRGGAQVRRSAQREGGAGGEEAVETPAHAPSTRRCAILSSMRRSAQTVARRS